MIYLSLAVLWVIGNESEAVMHGRGIYYKSTLLSTGVKVQKMTSASSGLPVAQKERNLALHYRQRTLSRAWKAHEGLEVNGDLNVFQILV